MQWNRVYIALLITVLSPVLLYSQPGKDNENSSNDNGKAVLNELLVKLSQTQSSTPFVVRKIFIEGNKKTRDKIILREVPFKENDFYLLPDLIDKMEDARRQLMNTSLFHNVSVTLKSFDGYDVDIAITVKERWYLFPVPYFKYVDRNLNQWLFENNAKLNRVNYGLKVLYNNATGNNDKLNVWLVNGYTKQVLLNYDRLYIDKKMKWGINTGLAYGKNREINYTTSNNKQIFFKDSSKYLLTSLRTYAELSYRRAIRTRHRFGIAYVSEKIGDTVTSLNPGYFDNARKKISYPEFYYVMNYFDVDYIPYPLKGYVAEIYFIRRGINSPINLWRLNAKASGSWKMATNTYFGLRASGSIKLPFHQPFYSQRFFGYNDFFMQGYEYYVVDGVAGGYLKATLTRELFNFNVPIRLKKEGSVLRIPFRIFAKIYGNTGYAYSPEPGNNTLNNRMLYSGGIGLDILTYYDFTVRFEWSFNQLGQNGLYLHRRSYF